MLLKLLYYLIGFFPVVCLCRITQRQSPSLVASTKYSTTRYSFGTIATTTTSLLATVVVFDWFVIVLCDSIPTKPMHHCYYCRVIHVS